LLRKKHGAANVITTDVKKPPKDLISAGTQLLWFINFIYHILGPHLYLDVMDSFSFNKIIVENNIDWLIHNSSLLSAAGEKNPHLAMQLNIQGLHNALEVSRMHNVRILAPSSIAAFGPSTPRDNTPDLVIMRPTTIYGVTKVYLELLGEYYHTKFGVDFRSLRYPGIISSETLPGGGTTDYAVEIFYEALKKGQYECFLSKDSALPMMYMPDCLKATVDFLEAPNDTLTQRVYNVNGTSFTPEQLAHQIRKYLPNFKMTYKPDFRQQIADSWPKSLDDTNARKDWSWQPQFDLDGITKDMLQKLKLKL
jgi:threonine 3-dehydrogenase